MVQAEKIKRERILRQAFWSGKISYRKWRGILRDDATAHRNILLQAFRCLPISWLLHELGEDRFVKIWPALRDGFDVSSPEERNAKDAWDAVWGITVAGDSQYPVDPAIGDLPIKRREILKLVINRPGVTAYSIAKVTGRSYSRVHKDIVILVEKGIIEARQPLPGSARRERHLMPEKSINGRLVRMNHSSLSYETTPKRHPAG